MSSTAKGIFSSIKKLAWQTGIKPPWDPPLRVRIRQRRAGPVGHTLYFERVKT